MKCHLAPTLFVLAIKSFTLVRAYPTLLASAILCHASDESWSSLECLKLREGKSPVVEASWEKRSSPRRHWPPPLPRSSTLLGSSSSSSEDHSRERAEALERSQSFQGVAQIGHALVGSFVVSQALNMDLYHRRQRGAMDLTLPNIEGSNPFNSLNPLHAIVGAAVSQVVTDPRGTYNTVKGCVGIACETVSKLVKGKQSTLSSPGTSRNRSPPTSPRVEGVTGWKKVRKYKAREMRMANSQAKKAMSKQQSIIHKA